jgi:NTE family protein
MGSTLAVMETSRKRKKVGLVLGSGGAKGLAHIGVIKILEEHKIPINFIAGSSIGAMVGGFYVSGLSSKEMEEIALSTDWRRIVSVLADPKLKNGLIGGDKTTAFIERYVKGKQIEDCHIPFAAIATDLATGEIVVLRSGSMSSAIRASVSIPLAYTPVEVEGRILVDGGLAAPVPVSVARAVGMDVVVAVNLEKHYCSGKWKPGWYGIADNSLSIMRHHLSILDASHADVVIDVDLERTPWYQFTNGRNKILAGEKAAETVLPRLEKVLLN